MIIRGRYVNAVSFERLLVLDIHHPKRRDILKKYREQVVCMPASVLNDNDRDTEMLRQAPEEQRQGGKTTPRSANDDDALFAHRTFRKIFSGPLSCSYLSSYGENRIDSLLPRASTPNMPRL